MYYPEGENMFTMLDPQGEHHHLVNHMFGNAKRDYFISRWPRLIRCMQWIAMLSQSEAVSALEAYTQGRDNSCEAVNHYGGARKVVSDAFHRRHIILPVYKNLHGIWPKGYGYYAAKIDLKSDIEAEREISDAAAEAIEAWWEYNAEKSLRRAERGGTAEDVQEAHALPDDYGWPDVPYRIEFETDELSK